MCAVWCVREIVRRGMSRRVQESGRRTEARRLILVCSRSLSLTSLRNPVFSTSV